MSKLLQRPLKRLLFYAGLILVLSIPVYYLALTVLWRHELDEHRIVLTPEAGREDTLLLITAVTCLTVLFFILLLAGFILINRRITKRLWKPFYNSLQVIRNFDLQQTKAVKFENTNIDEFYELNLSLHRLLTANIETYRQQKEFADNASHELQTPLAIARSKLEMVLQGRELSAEQNEGIEDALKAIARVGRINKNLLFLTKIENSQFMDKEELDVSKLANDIITSSSYFSEDKNIVLSTQIKDNVRVSGNRMLVEILIQNLLNNAIRYTPENGNIEIALTEETLHICNSGTVSLDHQRLFKRFVTASSETAGTGLGLAIVKQICMRYTWKIDYEFFQQKHQFLLQF